MMSRTSLGSIATLYLRQETGCRQRIKALKSDSIIQLFSEVRYLDRSSTDKLEFDAIPELVRSSAGSQLIHGEFKDVCLVKTGVCRRA